MRLTILNSGHTFPQRLKMKLMGFAGIPVLDVVKTFMYRPEFFGRPFCDLGQMWQRASEIADRDVEALRLVGYAEDQIFEATICAALGAGLARLQIGLDAAGFTWAPFMPDAYRALSP